MRLVVWIYLFKKIWGFLYTRESANEQAGGWRIEVWNTFVFLS